MPREPLDPNKIFRECDARDLFGFGITQLKEKIKSGDIPAPKLLSAPPSRARGWWGWQVNEWYENVEKQQAAWAAATTDVKGDGSLRYVPKGGVLSKPTEPKPAVKPEKIKGLKRPDRRSAKA